MEHERFLPGTEGAIWYEHWHRYHFVVPLAKGLDVLDVACGEGYGSALLAAHARHVIGVDVAPDIVAQARRRYGGAGNIEFLEGNTGAIPAGDSSVDVAVSFETIEHVENPEGFLQEADRVLRPGGLLAVSTPNKEVYSDRRGYRNPHHRREFHVDEFEAMLRALFPHVTLYGQRVDAYSAIWPLSGAQLTAELLDARRWDADCPRTGIADAMYVIALCRREAAPPQRAFSLFSDREHEVLGACESLEGRIAGLEHQVERIEAAYAASQGQVAALLQERERLLARLAQLEAGAASGRWRTR